jgi:hypothetical protein
MVVAGINAKFAIRLFGASMTTACGELMAIKSPEKPVR